MLFESIYSQDFRTVGKIINSALEKKGLSYGEIKAIVERYSIGDANIESVFDNLVAEKNWPFLQRESESINNRINKKYISTIENKYQRPMSLVEKKWLNTICQDKRMQLFSDDHSCIDESGILFDMEDIVFYDQNNDGDPYDDENYIKCFRSILRAIHEKRYIKVKYCTINGKEKTFDCFPIKLEYSLRNDKFRLINGFVGDPFRTSFLRLSGIESVDVLGICDNPEQYNAGIKKKSVVIEVSGEKSTKERFLLHFSPLRRETEKIGDNLWRVTIYYDEDSEEEIVIDILSFGRYVKVVEPESFKASLKRRLSGQKDLL